MRPIFTLIFIFLIGLISMIDANAQCDLYELDILTDQPITSDYNVSCYSNISSSHWTVTHDTCSFSTRFIDLNDDSGELVSLPLSVEILSANSTTNCDDYVIIEYQVDTSDWVFQDSINACDIPTSAWNYNFNVVLSDTSSIRLRITYYVYDNQGSLTSEKLRLRDGGICIGLPEPLTTLPVDLIKFNAFSDDYELTLKWSTASESGNERFIIEKRQSGGEFQPIGEVKAKGDISITSTYTFKDLSPEYGRNYYRLRWVDRTGNEDTSKVVSAEYNIQSVNGNLKVFPNPAENGTFNICITGVQSKKVLVVLYDAVGNRVFSKLCVLEKGKNFTVIGSDKNLPPGVYLVVGSSDNEMYKHKLVIR